MKKLIKRNVRKKFNAKNAEEEEMKKKVKFSKFKNEVDFSGENDLGDVPPSLYFKYIDSLIVDRRDGEKFLDLIEFKINKKILVSFDEYSKLEALAQEVFIRMNLMKFYKEIGY